METEIVVGCDISQDQFSFCLRNRSEILSEGQVVNQLKSIKTWLNNLKKAYGTKMDRFLFAMEHTGIYGAILLRELDSRSLPVCVESAMNIKLSMGMHRGKNDKVDARRIADYALRNMDRLKVWRPKRPVLTRLQLLIRMRDRLVKARADLSRFNKDAKRFLPKQEYQILTDGTARTIASMDQDIKNANANIEKLIQEDANLKRLASLVTSVDHIGMVTCSAILVKTNEFLDFTNTKKFACTAGIAPFEHTSGSSIRGKTRVSHHAHKELKKLLHMCALGAIARKGELRDYYLRMVAQGKNKMLVINNVRNKLVARIFAVVRDGVMYQKNYKYNLAMS